MAVKRKPKKDSRLKRAGVSGFNKPMIFLRSTDLPDPDAIFVGGTGRQLASIVGNALVRLKSGGRIVADMTSIENLNEVQTILRSTIVDVNVLMVNVSRGNYQLERLSFDSLTPKFILSAVKP